MEKVMEYLCYHGVNIDSNSGNKMLNRSEMRAKALDMIENTRKDINSTRLTKIDGVAWWEFIRLCLPINYERAQNKKKIKEDMIIGDLDGIERLNINDYFELYNLPRVTAENGIISVNVSPIQLLSEGFVEELADLIETFKVDPSLLEVEITDGNNISVIDLVNIS